MARPIILSNGSLHVGINNYGLVHDFYFPYVGSENHSAGRSLRHKVGIWIDGQLSWLDDGSWDISFRAASDSLVGHVKARHDELGILLEFDDFVDASTNVFFRNIHIINLSDERKEVRLFMHQAFVIGDTRSMTDTAQYLPGSNALLHYRGNRAFVVSGTTRRHGAFDQHSIGIFGTEGKEGTYRDADDGELANGMVEHGRVDSTLRFVLPVAGHSSERVEYWITAGESVRDAVNAHNMIKDRGLGVALSSTINWWHDWLAPSRSIANMLSPQEHTAFSRSLLLVKSHIDDHGAVIASTDSAMLKNWRDAYAYCWPRDGAYAVWPLIRLGYKDEPLAFFEFCRDALHPNGYIMHKYNSDGSLGPSWHPYVHGDSAAPPIQEDESALVLFVFCQYYIMHPEKELLDEYYDSFVKKIANFLVEFIDPKTKLPKPSYDLWEEVYITTTYTTSVVCAALQAAAELADKVNDSENALRWRSASEDMRVAAMKLLYNHRDKSFRKGILTTESSTEYNDTIDAASFYGPFMFGLVDTRGEELSAMYERVTALLKRTTGIGRYENDVYMKQDGKESNMWFICTLWLAQYAYEVDDKEAGDELVEWVLSHQSSTGMLAEQLDPVSEAPLSVSPLTWSHAELLSTLIDRANERDKK